MLQPLNILRIPKLAAISLKESLTKHQPISIQTAQYLSHLWMHYRWLPQTRTPLSKINKAISQLVSTLFETKSFKPWNKVFQAGKQSVSHRETDWFQALKQFLKLIATGEEMVKLLPFTHKLLIHRGNREKVKGELKRWEINIQWEKLFDSVRNRQIVHSLWTNSILSFSHRT